MQFKIVKMFCLWLLCAEAVLLAQSSANIATVKGRVLTEDGTPLAGAMVYFQSDHPSTGRPTTVQTDQSGNYEVTLQESGTYTIHAFKSESGYPDVLLAFDLSPNQVVRRVTVTSGKDLAGVDVKLGSKSAMLHLHAIDKGTRQPLKLTDYKLCHVQEPKYCLNSRGPGDFDLLVPPTEMSIQASSPGYADTNYREENRPFIRMRPSEERDVVLSLAHQ